MWRFLKKPPLIGLDITFNEIRLLQLKKSGAHWHIEHCVCQPLFSESSMSAQLAEIILQRKMMSYPVAIAVSDHQVLKKKISFPSQLKEADIAADIHQNHYQYLPECEREEMFVDFSILRIAHDTQDILLVATQKQPLQSYIDTVKQAGLKLSIIDVDVYALARAKAQHADLLKSEPRFLLCYGLAMRDAVV